MRSEMKIWVKFVLLFVLALGLIGVNSSCLTVTLGPEGEDSGIKIPLTPGGQSTTTGADWQLPSIESFAASPSSIAPGSTSTLAWSVFGATQVTIDQGIGSAASADSAEVSPLDTTTYTLTATNASGSVTRSVTVAVGTGTPPPTSPPTPTPTPIPIPTPTPIPTSPPSPPSFTPPPTIPSYPSSPPSLPSSPPSIISFTASPTSISAGSSTTLNWSVSGASAVTIGPGGGYVSSSGSAVATPGSTTTFTLTATNTAGTVTRSVTVTVAAAPPPAPSLPVINSFTATPASISAGGSSTLSWSITGATSASIAPGGGIGPSGSAPVTPGSTTTYTITASNAAGTVTRPVTVTVTGAPPPASPPVINSFTATPASISAGGSSTLSWSITGATSASIAPGGGIGASGSTAVTPGATTTYTLTASNAAGTVTRPVTVTVAAAPPPPSGDTATCEQALFDAVNAKRAASGRAALTRNATIDGLCRQHAEYMRAASALSHDNFSARCSSIYASIPAMHRCAENVLQSNLPCDAADMAQMWFDSPGHNANMLNAAYTIAGMGIVTDGSGRIWACQIFSGP